MKIVVALALLCCSSAVLGQGQTGSIRSDDKGVSIDKEGRLSGDAARAVGDKFATCIVTRHYTPVVKALDLPQNSQEQYDALHKVFDAECWATGSAYGGNEIELTTNPVSFRQSMFRALVRKYFSSKPLVLVPQPLTATASVPGMLAFADCVVRLNAPGSLALIQSVPGTEVERTAIDGLRPQFSQCLEPGNTVSLSKSSVGAAIAEAYYREAQAAKKAGAR